MIDQKTWWYDNLMMWIDWLVGLGGHSLKHATRDWQIDSTDHSQPLRLSTCDSWTVDVVAYEIIRWHTTFIIPLTNLLSFGNTNSLHFGYVAACHRAPWQATATVAYLGGTVQCPPLARPWKFFTSDFIWKGALFAVFQQIS